MLQELLRKKRDGIIDTWFNLVLELFPSDSSQFLKNQKNKFSNPVGNTISSELSIVFDEIAENRKTEKLLDSLEKIIKIMSIQNLSPSEGIEFTFLLKKAIRSEIKQELESGQFYSELMEFESRVDTLAGLAFNLYVESREKIFEIRVNEIKARSNRLIERLNLIASGKKSQDNPKDFNL